MIIELLNNSYRYAAEQILLTMFPGERPEYGESDDRGDKAEIALFHGERYSTAICRLRLEGKVFTGRARALRSRMTDDLTRDRFCQRIVKIAFYRAAISAGRPKPVWGCLTGIRPGKLMSDLLESGLSDRAARTAFCRDYDVAVERAELCLQTAHASMELEKKLLPRDVCLYVGIPFCPTRCAYCSFVSQSVQRSMKLIPEYLDALYREIAATGEAVKALGLRPVSLYFGGGTPTTLSAEQLDALCSRMESAFDLSSVAEFTVEAGRPDTITAEKLRTLKAHRVTRVSVNPQTMDDAVLEAIGRRHTAAEVLTALDMVRAEGGLQVNMDLIAGLPADTPESFRRTVDVLLSLSPENITIHTLALKKGSEIMLEDTKRPSAEQVGAMLDYGASALRGGGYAPYYLYRQKYMSGGFENVGWQRDGTENIYNICIMEELCSIISMGGGGSTKLCAGNGRIERLFDPKYPAEYIAGIEKVISDKGKIIDILGGRV